MQTRILAITSATALLLAAGPGVAQDEATSDDMVSVSVAGTMVEVPVSLAAQACGLDEATIRANAFTAEMDAQETGEATTTAPDPMETAEDVMSSDDAAATDMAAGTADGADAETQAEGTGELAAADVADEAATAAAVGDDTSGAADAATTADNSADSATADEAAETVDGLEPDADAGAEVAGMAVCEVDQATAEQFGLPTGS